MGLNRSERAGIAGGGLLREAIYLRHVKPSVDVVGVRAVHASTVTASLFPKRVVSKTALHPCGLVELHYSQ